MTGRILGTRNVLRWALHMAIAAMIPASPAIAAQTPDAADEAEDVRQIEIDRTPWTGDFDGMVERRHIRVLVPYSRTLFFVDKGRERGLTAELARDFERYLNQKYKTKLQRRPITISLIPTTRDKLMSHLAQGLGDIAGGNLTITPERLRIADFAGTDRPMVRELVVSGPGSPGVATLDDLSGKTVDVRRASSYYESLVALNSKLASSGKPPVKLAFLPDALEDEDALEMLNAGLIEFTVVDSWKARIWAQALPKIRVRQDLALRTDGRVGWAIRRQSPKLQAEIDAFYKGEVRKKGLIEYRIAQYEKQVKQITANTKGAALKRFEQTLALFEKYGQKYDFDPLMLVAQGYQESQLNQNAKSHVGAIGVMQIMPATGKELKVGDIRQLEPNIHGGAKYMDKLMAQYFSDASFSETDRALFAFASYNAGPGTISRMRQLATKRGLNPNEWFNNVELVVAKNVGMETTTYVRNIFKYYVAYKLTIEAHEAQKKARQSVTASERGATP